MLILTIEKFSGDVVKNSKVYLTLKIRPLDALHHRNLWRIYTDTLVNTIKAYAAVTLAVSQRNLFR